MLAYGGAPKNWGAGPALLSIAVLYMFDRKTCAFPTWEAGFLPDSVGLCQTVWA